jgi:hypothetical protein
MENRESVNIPSEAECQVHLLLAHSNSVVQFSLSESVVIFPHDQCPTFILCVFYIYKPTERLPVSIICYYELPSI